jgi:hypothetical protein
MTNLQDIIKDLHARRRIALKEGVCVGCNQLPQFYSEAGQREYGISGYCEFCFDLFAVEPEELCKHCQKPESWHTHGKTTCGTYERVGEDGDTEDGHHV